MANSHGLPNVAAEVQAQLGDLLAPAILSSTLTVPGSGLTLPAFSTLGYVKNGSPTRLVHVNQPAAPVTIAGGDGSYWLALMHDTHSAVAGWTRTPGTHYAWCTAGTQPADPPGGLVMAALTVAGGTITVVDTTPNYPYQKVAFGGSTGQLAFDKNLTWNGSTLHVAGTVEAQHHLMLNRAGDGVVAFQTDLLASGGTNRWALYAGGTAQSYLGGALTVNGHIAGVTLGVTSAATVGTSLGVGGVLTVSGASSLQNVTTQRLGIAFPAPSNVWCRSGWLVADALGANLGDVVPSYTLHVAGTAYVSGTAGVGRGPSAPWALCLGGTSSLFTDGTIYSGGSVDASSLNVRAVGSTFGATNQGYWLNVGNVHSAGLIYGLGAVDCNTLNVRTGNSFFAGGVGIGWANEAGFWLTVPNIKTGSVTWTDTSYGGHLTLGGNVNCANVVASANIYGATATFTESVNWSTPSTGSFLTLTGNVNCANVIASNNLYGVTAVMTGELQAASIVISTGQAYKVGGGAWLDSSARQLKRNIQPIPDALGLLLEQRGRVYEWDEPRHAALLPGPRYGFVYDEVTIDQWRTQAPDGSDALAIQGADALIVEALRQIVERLEALEGAA